MNPTRSPSTPSSSDADSGVTPPGSRSSRADRGRRSPREQRGIGDGGRERSDLVERRGKGDEAVSRHPPVGRLHADHATQRRRLADRAAGVGAERERGEAGRHRRGAPPDEPPGTRDGSWGLRVGPNAEFSVEDPIANSSRFVFPTTMRRPPRDGAPPWRRRAVASPRGSATSTSSGRRGRTGCPSGRSGPRRGARDRRPPLGARRPRPPRRGRRRR